MKTNSRQSTDIYIMQNKFNKNTIISHHFPCFFFLCHYRLCLHAHSILGVSLYPCWDSVNSLVISRSQTSLCIHELILYFEFYSGQWSAIKMYKKLGRVISACSSNHIRPLIINIRVIQVMEARFDTYMLQHMNRKPQLFISLYV